MPAKTKADPQPDAAPEEVTAPAEVINPDVVVINTNPAHPLFHKPDPGAVKENDAVGLQTPA